MLWINLTLALFILGAVAFSTWAVYVFLIGKPIAGQEMTTLGKMIKFYGAGVIWLVLGTCIVTLAFLFCYVILSGLHLVAAAPADIINSIYSGS